MACWTRQRANGGRVNQSNDVRATGRSCLNSI
jgi:hypothetical protein